MKGMCYTPGLQGGSTAELYKVYLPSFGSANQTRACRVVPPKFSQPISEDVIRNIKLLKEVTKEINQ